MTPLDSTLTRLLAPVEDGMARMRDLLSAQLDSDVPAVSDMTQHITRFRGKQLRAALVLLVAEAVGNESEELPEVATVVEMIHLATLVHDDVLDGAHVRRRMASVNRRWDNQVAVLLGDFLYARAFHLSTTLSSTLCSRLLAETTQRICAGEIEQAASRYDFDQDDAGYEVIAGAKTAALYSAACRLGAIYPHGEDAGVGEELRLFGWEVGLAFQIIDDVLDLVGTEETVGKSVGNDVDDGKVTLPVLRVYRDANPETRALIRDAYTVPEEGDRVRRLRSACDLEPGVDYAMGRARQLVGRALDRIRRLRPSQAREALEVLGGYVLGRTW